MIKQKKYVKENTSEVRRILNAFKYSYNGFIETLKSEAAFREDLFIFILFLPIAFIVDVTKAQRALLVFALIFILFAECVNTAIEVAIDRISSDIHPLSKKAKDIGSFVVLLAFINAILTWGIVLL